MFWFLDTEYNERTARAVYYFDINTDYILIVYNFLKINYIPSSVVKCLNDNI